MKSALLLCVAISTCFSVSSKEAETILEPPHKRIIWNKTPILVSFERVETLDTSYLNSLNDAINAINSQVECTLLAFSSSEIAEVVIVNDSMDYDYRQPGAETFKNAGEGNPRATIKFYRPGDVIENYITYYHELGHVLGLSHYSFGVMKVDAVSFYRDNLLGGNLMPKFTSEQVNYIKQTYCPRRS